MTSAGNVAKSGLEVALPRPGARDLLYMAARSVAKFLAPQLTIPTRCTVCRSWLQMLEESVGEFEGGYLVRHTRFWLYEACEDRTAETSVYFRQLDHWDAC